MGEASETDGDGALRLMTLGGELTPATRGAGSSAWTTFSQGFVSADFTGSGGAGASDFGRTGEHDFDGCGVGGLTSTVGTASARLSLDSDFLIK